MYKAISIPKTVEDAIDVINQESKVSPETDDSILEAKVWQATARFNGGTTKTMYCLDKKGAIAYLYSLYPMKGLKTGLKKENKFYSVELGLLLFTEAYTVEDFT